MNAADHYLTRYLEAKDLDQYNALLRYTFQVTEEELTATGWKDDEIKQSKFPVLERADVLGCFDGDTLVSQFAVYPLKMNIYDTVYLNREAQKGLWEYIHAHDSMIDEVHGSTYFSEPIAFEMDDGDIKESIRPYAMGRIIDVEDFLADYPCDPDGGTLCIELEIEDSLLPWNDRTFNVRFADGHCTMTREPAEYHLKMGIGTFTTLLLGYKTAERLYELERIEGREEAVERLDDVLFHKIPYISDYI